MRRAGRLPADVLSVPAFEIDGSAFAIDARDPQFVSLLHAEALVGAVEGHHVDRPVVLRKGLLGAGVAPGDEPFRCHGGSVDDTVAHQALADDGVDPLAQAVARRHQPGIGALFRGQREPARGGGAREVVRLHLRDVVPELLEGCCHGNWLVSAAGGE